MNRNIRENLQERIIDGLKLLMSEGKLTVDQIPQCQLEIPRDSTYGDVCTNVAMQLARQARMKPLLIAEHLMGVLKTPKFQNDAYYEDVQIAGQGFLNFTLNEKAFECMLLEIFEKDGSFGKEDNKIDIRVLVEFVSANPTGPLTLAHGRQAAVGDVLSNILQWAGYCVTREYYLNDRGKQISLLGESVISRCKMLDGEEVQFPEDGYQGEYIWDVARQILLKHPKASSCDLENIARSSYQIIFERHSKGFGGIWGRFR
ncbi:MAG: arginine--tRNA ligase [Candidatus Theseobacter exili]|nr:arginine--tRNA ligase [Candidatus Theseobacter exili]